MRITYRCHQCDATCVESNVTAQTRQLTCRSCGQTVRLPEGAWDEGRLQRCLVCPCRELFVRKDFNQRLGVGIIVLGFALSTVAWALRRPLWTYGILFATAAIDMVLYFLVGNLVQCYRCHAEYRDLDQLESYQPFDLETHERFRQEAARVAAARAAQASTASAAESGPGTARQ